MFLAEKGLSVRKWFVVNWHIKISSIYVNGG